VERWKRIGNWSRRFTARKRVNADARTLRKAQRTQPCNRDGLLGRDDCVMASCGSATMRTAWKSRSAPIWSNWLPQRCGQATSKARGVLERCCDTFRDRSRLRRNLQLAEEIDAKIRRASPRLNEERRSTATRFSHAFVQRLLNSDGSAREPLSAFLEAEADLDEIWQYIAKSSLDAAEQVID